MHKKYHDLLDPAYLRYALDVESAPRLERHKLAQMREQYNQSKNLHSSPDYAKVRVDEFSFTGRDKNKFSLRCYTPPDAVSHQLTLYLHGGGWVLGSLDTHDDICMDISLATGRAVLAVDYRLAPENPFPAALHDVCDVIQALQQNSIRGIDASDSLVLSGDSAGANLSVASCLSGEIHTADLKGTVLIYPGLGADDSFASFRDNEFAPVLPNRSLEIFFDAYLDGDISKASPLTSPLLADDFSMLPPCFISAAEHDPLRDDSLEFCHRLDESGVFCRLRVEDTLGHGYLRVRHASEAAADAFTAACEAVTSHA